MLDIEEIRLFLVSVEAHYEKSAPTVSRWADDLYIRLGDDLSSVRVIELLHAQALYQDEEWQHPNYAANRIYKLMHELGQDTTGHAGF